MPEYEPINEVSLDRNEYTTEPAEAKPYKPREKGSGEESSDETDEEFSWYDPNKHNSESHFVFVN